MVTFNSGDVVSVPFPFTDQAATKRRPAIVLTTNSFNDRHKHAVLAMVTSAKNPPWPSGLSIVDLKSAGLSSASVVRMKLFTLDERLIVGIVGKLSKPDKDNALKRVAESLGMIN
jgi:mRNA interferase MazF